MEVSSFRKMKSSNVFFSIRKLVIVVTGLSCYPVYSQIGDDRLNFTMEAALPSGRANPAYRNYLNGLINAQPKLQYRFAKTLFVAAGARYSYYTVSEFKVPQKTTGGANTFGGFVEIGWTKWQTPRFGLEFSLKTGFAQHVFITGLTRETGIQRVTAPFVQPTISLVLAADEAVAYRWILGYNIDGFDFKPYHLGMNTMDGYSESDLSKPSQSLLVGFAFTYYFGNERSE